MARTYFQALKYWRRAIVPFGLGCVFLWGCATHTLLIAPRIRVSEALLFGDMDCFKIETRAATYFLGKRGAGFARILDPDGHDWISYHPGDKARGEYRGLPKCGQPTKFFHCGYGYGQYTNDNWFRTAIAIQESARVQIHSETRRGDAVCEWDFYPDHATLTLHRCGTNGFWFLYEGTPGGELNVAEDFAVRPGGRKTPLTEPWTDHIPWVAFGAKESPNSLLLVNHQLGSPVDSYVSWPYTPEPDGGLNQMTVFGFGRLGWKDSKQHTPQLRSLPATFSIAMMRGSDDRAIEHALRMIKKEREP